MVRILVCEDDGRFRRLLIKLLSSTDDFDVVAEAGTGEEACELARSLDPDLMLLDLELPGIGGLEVIDRIVPHPSGTTIEVLVLTTFADEAMLFEAMRRGAAGYLVKGIAASKLVAAIREVMAGGTVIESRLAKRFWNYFASVRGCSGEDYGLTEEELQVLTLVGRGLSNPEAADILGFSRREVKSHLERIYRKLDVSSRVEATVRALQAGLIEL